MPRLLQNDRWRAVGMLQSGLSQREVAQRLNVHINTIGRLSNRFNRTRSTSDRPRSGRPRVTTARQDRYIQFVHLQDRFRPATVTARNIPGLQRISGRTVRNRLREANLTPHRPAIRPVLERHHQTARLNWATRHIRWVFNQWQQVLFTDESRFCLYTHDGRLRCYRRRGERYQDGCVVERVRQGGGSIMVWGGITWTDRTQLVLVDGNLNAVRYRDEIVDQHILPFINAHAPITLQQDNARPHVARVITDHLTNNNVDVLDWPAVSPDLSPIEHLWDEMDRRLRNQPNQPQNLNELGRELQNIWNNIQQDFIRRLIGSMRRRCQAVIGARGGHTRY